ncbi:hypothetical protein L3073_18480 [Ancylomarina sp. DW003]|nr:hypothetical protein [Ancylomarina sp. DW003]MDE5424203.1 hypothetical protein [Ancylomarina sp. DW003]
MKTILSKEDSKLFEIYLDIIVDATQNLNSGNIAHKAATIKNHAIAIKKIISKNKIANISEFN